MKKEKTQTTTTMAFEAQSPKLRRDVSSRFHEYSPSSPVRTLSPVRRKPDKTRPEDPASASASLRSLWPSSTSPTPTFGDHLRRDRLDDALERRTAKENRRPASRLDETASFRRQSSGLGVEVASRYMAAENKSPAATVRRARSMSLSGRGSSRTQWALSPGRSPATSPSRSSTNSVDKLLGNIGLGFFKSKKSSNSVPEFRLLHNRLIQWRFANARADRVNANVAKRVQSDLVSAWDGIRKLRHLVAQKKTELQSERLEMKLNSVLQSQFNLLGVWGDMERRHLAALSRTKESLHSVACRVPLIEGAKVEIGSARITIRQALELASSFGLMLTTFSPTAEKNVELMSKLANVVAQEKLLLEECLELIRAISILEIEERSLKCGITQMGIWQQHQKRGEKKEQEMSS